MRRLAAVLLAAVVAAVVRPTAAGAQTQENLERAIKLYEALSVERALTVFRTVINSPFEVTPAQRVTAYKYLGASFATLGQRDSSLTFFRAAIERDPFVDLDATKFTSVERNVFDEARRRSFKVAVRAFDRLRLDPAAGDRLSLVIATTHEGTLNATVEDITGAVKIPLYDGDNEGVREIFWGGRQPDTKLVPPGTYDLVLRGKSKLTERPDSARLRFTVAHEFPKLEDSVSALRPDQLLPERYPASAAVGNLFKGISIGVAAILIPRVAGISSLGSGDELALGLAGAGLGTGLTAFLVRRSNADIPDNVKENRRRQAQRAALNIAIRRRNDDRLALTTLVLTPAAGSGQ